MNKVKNVLVLLLVLVIGAVTSCKDDSGESDQEVKTRQLTSSQWKVTAVSLAPSTDAFAPGITFTFKNDGSYTAVNTDALPDMRDPFEPIPTAGQWSFVGGNFNQIRLIGTTAGGASANLLVTIVEISDSKLVINYDAFAPKQGDATVVTVTMAH